MPEVGIVNVPFVGRSDGLAWVHVAFMEEVDVPGVGTSGQRKTFVRRRRAEGDHLAGRELSPSEGLVLKFVMTGGFPTLMVKGVERVELTPSETVSRA